MEKTITNAQRMDCICEIAHLMVRSKFTNPYTISGIIYKEDAQAFFHSVYGQIEGIMDSALHID